MSLDLTDEGDRLLAFVKEGIALAKKLGCDEAQIAASASKQIRLVAENKQYSLANSLDSVGVVVTVHKDSKKGSARINSLSSDDLAHAISSAKELAAFSIPDKSLTLANKSLAPKAKKLGFLYDKALEKFNLNELKEGMELSLSLLSEPKIALDRLELQVSTSKQVLANSAGVLQNESQSVVHWDYLGMARNGEAVSGMDYGAGFSYTRKNYEKALTQDLQTFAKNILQNLDPVTAPSYKGEVIFGPRAVEDILLDTILYHASGYQVMDGKSKWAKKVGKKIGHKLLTIMDRPHDKRFSGATAYDGDGVPTKERTLVKNGTLKLHMYDCYSAKRMKKKSNGFAGGPFALEIQQGKDKAQDFFMARKKILYVESFSGNIDELTGDFSGVAKCSSLYVNGERQGPVGETMISGNVFDLIQRILGVSREQHMVFGATLSPTMLIDGVSVSGKA